jgi:hypothetical protein
MRKYDKKLKIQKANILVEKRYLESKGLISESFHSPDGTPIGVNHKHEPINNETHLAPKGELDGGFTDPASDDDATLMVRIKVLSNALNYYEIEGDLEMVNRLKSDIQSLEGELNTRSDLDRDFFGRELNENKDKEKYEAWEKFQKDNYVTDKTVKAAWRDFEKEWESKNKK